MPDYPTLVEKGLIKDNRKELFSEFCSYKLTNLYSLYIESQRYTKEIDEVKTHDGRRIGLLYKFVSKNFCKYFENNKFHSIKIKEEIKNGIHNNHNDNIHMKNSKSINKNNESK